nr:unnamed protein product [Callosobruchus analis]
MDTLEAAPTMSLFEDVELGPPIEVFLMNKLYNEDSFPDKVNLGVGAYRTNDGKPWVLPVVRVAEQALANDQLLNKEYLPVLGLETFASAATKMLLGADNWQHLVFKNHKLVFKNAGFEEGREYRYWCSKSRALDINGMLEDLRNAPEDSVIILHSCAHNPTGCDPTPEQLFPFFDSAYQGFASGDLDKDAAAVRNFADKGFELFCAQSFAKNFGLYNERVGNLTVILNNVDLVPNVKSQLTLLIRGMYSNPPSHGARIVSYVLSNKDLYNQWKENIRIMSSRIIQMRQMLREALERLGTPGDWRHITQQIGMFSYTGLNG